VSPRIEQLVYETRLFVGENVPLRSGRCYLSDSSNDQLIVLWLEDLSDAPQPPWQLQNSITAANHLGQFNGELAIRPIELPFEMLEDGFQLRWGSQDYGAIAEQMLEARYSSVTQQAYSQAPVDAGIKLAKLVRPVLERARSLPHSIAFGDSHSRNMFPLGSQAVGMDWMAVSSETTGVDIGVLIGSNLTFGVSKAAMIIDNEKKSTNRTPKESNPQDRLVILPICGLGFSPSSLANCRHWLRSR